MNLLQEMLRTHIFSQIQQLWNNTIRETDILISSTPNPELGHLASSVAFILAKHLKQSPTVIAEKLATKLQDHPDLQKVQSTKGYINIFFNPAFLLRSCKKLLNDPKAYQFDNQHQKIHLEFISANPTGPLHIGHGRWAILGDSLARILKRVGYNVFTEFYVNDAGNQIQKLKESVIALKNGQPVPEDGYHGEYLKEVAQTDEEPVDFFKKQHENLIKKIGVTMDNYYSEKSLIENKEIDKAITKLREQNLIYSKDGATFFATSQLGDDKDRALIKSDGSFTYFAPDIAYHYTKIQSGAHWIIDILGADHHGYVKRITATVEALSHHQTRFTVLLGQLVNLMKNGEPIKMSKRAGNIVSLQEVVDEIGVDALRIVLLSKKFNHSIDFDLDVLSSKSKENPLFYIQYAYARIQSILSTLPYRDQAPQDAPTINHWDYPEELQSVETSLLLHALNYKETIQMVVREMDPYYLYAYIYDLASLFHKFYEKIRIREKDMIIFYRVSIIEGVAKILVDASTLLGISMPEKI